MKNASIAVRRWMLILGFGALGCAADPGDELDVNDTEAVASTQEGLYTSISATWNQGMSTVVIKYPGTNTPIDASSYFCYLTRVSGKFEGGGERVHVVAENNQWRLKGASQQQGVSATAHCSPLDSGIGMVMDPTEYSWMQGQAPTPMSPTMRFDGTYFRHYYCFLTRMQGHFEGSGETIKIWASGNNWMLGGGSAQQGVGARARCVGGIDLSSSEGPMYNIAPPRGSMNVPISDDGGNSYYGGTSACFMQSISGHFEGGGEVLSLYPNANDNGRWYFYGQNGQDTLPLTSLRCIY